MQYPKPEVNSILFKVSQLYSSLVALKKGNKCVWSTAAGQQTLTCNTLEEEEFKILSYNAFVTLTKRPMYFSLKWNWINQLSKKDFNASGEADNMPAAYNFQKTYYLCFLHI